MPETFQARFPFFLSSLYSDPRENFLAASAEEVLSAAGRPRNIAATRDKKAAGTQGIRVGAYVDVLRLPMYPPLFNYPSGFCCMVYILLHKQGKLAPLKAPVDIQWTRDHTRKKDHIIS